MTTALQAGRELDALVAEKVMGQVPCDAWYYANLGSAGGPVAMKNSDACDHASCYPSSALLPEGLRGAPNYSTDIAAAWLVVEKMHRHGVYIDVHTNGWGYKTTWGRAGHGDEDIWVYGNSESADTAPHAICKAALAAMESNQGAR